jgi:hypothetical protein
MDAAPRVRSPLLRCMEVADHLTRFTLEEFVPNLRGDESCLTYWWGAGLRSASRIMMMSPNLMYADDLLASGWPFTHTVIAPCFRSVLLLKLSIAGLHAA